MYSLLWNVIFLLIVRAACLVRFDHGLAISSRSIVSVRSHSHTKSQEFTEVFLVHYWTHNSFHWFQLWKAVLGGCRCYRNCQARNYRIFDWPRHFWGASGCILPQKIFDFLRLRNAISCILGAVQTKYQFHKQWHNDYNFILWFTPILRLRIRNIFGRTSLIRCIIKKCLCSIVVIFGRWPAFLLLGYLCTHTASHFLRHCRARIMLLYIENWYSLSLNLNSIDSYT
jgi:hypothetical protein